MRRRRRARRTCGAPTRLPAERRRRRRQRWRALQLRVFPVPSAADSAPRSMPQRSLWLRAKGPCHAVGRTRSWLNSSGLTCARTRRSLAPVVQAGALHAPHPSCAGRPPWRAKAPPSPPAPRLRPRPPSPPGIYAQPQAPFPPSCPTWRPR
ncbi:MAG: hypothetical protein J3K34DRAFT_400167 [Monoraphidium minutum]|nr:MAG: hypothetical protein J3K34DRAFT_400167 [Monoraphidium minutum]